MSIVLQHEKLRTMLECRTEEDLVRIFGNGRLAWRVMSFKGKPSWVSGPYMTTVHEAHGELHILFEERDGPGMAVPFSLLLDAEPFTLFTTVKAAKRYIAEAARVFDSDDAWQKEHDERIAAFHRALEDAGLVDREYASTRAH